MKDGLDICKDYLKNPLSSAQSIINLETKQFIEHVRDDENYFNAMLQMYHR